MFFLFQYLSLLRVHRDWNIYSGRREYSTIFSIPQKRRLKRTNFCWLSYILSFNSRYTKRQISLLSLNISESISTINPYELLHLRSVLLKKRKIYRKILTATVYEIAASPCQVLDRSESELTACGRKKHGRFFLPRPCYYFPREIASPARAREDGEDAFI